MIPASQYQTVTDALNRRKAELNLFGEVKWEKVTEQYLGHYIDLMCTLFRLLSEGRFRIRIMFRQNAHEPVGLTSAHRENEYFLLYYQFLKHGFQLALCPEAANTPALRLYFDQFPDTKAKTREFREHLLRMLQDTPFVVRESDVAEVRSHEHVLLQCLDVVMGAMTFRLNDKHKQKMPGKRRRGKRTRAKEKLYRIILGEIRKLHPGFNIGESTGGSRTWSKPYAHWKFVPRDMVFHPERTKRAHQRKNPAQPT
jgi:hypothetical protein